MQVQVLDYRLVVCKFVLDFRLVCKFKFWIADLLCASSSSRLQTCCVQVQVLDCRLVVCKFQFSIADLLCASSSSRLQTCCVQVVQVLDCRLVVCKKFKFWTTDLLCASWLSISDLCASSSSGLQTCRVQVGSRFQTCLQVQVLDYRLVVCKLALDFRLVCKFKFSIADKLRSPDDRYNPVVNENGGFSVTAVAVPPISRQPCIDTWTLWIMIIIDASCYNGNQRWKALDFLKKFFGSCVYVNKTFFFFFFYY